jgi:hypothetical protein
MRWNVTDPIVDKLNRFQSVKKLLLLPAGHYIVTELPEGKMK